MSDFKIGDKVEVLRENNTWWGGTQGIISKIAKSVTYGSIYNVIYIKITFCPSWSAGESLKGITTSFYSSDLKKIGQKKKKLLVKDLLL